MTNSNINKVLGVVSLDVTGPPSLHIFRERHANELYRKQAQLVDKSGYGKHRTKRRGDG